MVKKLALICLIGTLLSMTAHAQIDGKQVKKFEFELSVGTTLGIDKFVGNKRIGPAFAVEGRYNFPQQPIDIGLELYLGCAFRQLHGVDLSNRIFSSMIFTDYNFRRGEKIAPFVGIGMGVASCDAILGGYGYQGAAYIASPRVGIEFLNHIRLTCYSKICKEGYNNIGLSVGYAFGGGVKKK